MTQNNEEKIFLHDLQILKFLRDSKHPKYEEISKKYIKDSVKALREGE